jgi:spore coat protein A
VPDIWVIGTDGGLLDRPVRIAAPERLLMAPGERYDVLVASRASRGQTLTLVNDAPAPFPDGDAPDPETTGQIAQFRVVKPLSSPGPGAGRRPSSHGEAIR